MNVFCCAFSSSTFDDANARPAQLRLQFFAPQAVDLANESGDLVPDQSRVARAGDRPSMLISVVRVSICCHRPATRTMKNSSIFDPRIETNLTRSSSGFARILRLLEHAPLKREQAQMRIEI